MYVIEKVHVRGIVTWQIGFLLLALSYFVAPHGSQNRPGSL